MNIGTVIKLTLLFTMLSLGTASSQPIQYLNNMIGPQDYSNNAMGQIGQYSAATSTSAPAPANPTAPESLGLQTPSVTASQQAPTNAGEIPRVDNVV